MIPSSKKSNISTGRTVPKEPTLTYYNDTS